MKRLIIFFMLGELLLLCSGCEKKELECVKVEEGSKVKITPEFDSFNFFLPAKPHKIRTSLFLQNAYHIRTLIYL